MTTDLFHLPWLPICFQVQFKVLILTFKPYGMGPIYLKKSPSPMCIFHFIFKGPALVAPMI